MKIREMCNVCGNAVSKYDSYCSECGECIELIYELELEEYEKKEKELAIAEEKYGKAKTQKTEEKWQAIMEKLQDELDDMYEI